jgi:hypothetical protein
MTVWENTANGGTDGVSVSSDITLTGGASGTQFNYVHDDAQSEGVTFVPGGTGLCYQLDWATYPGLVFGLGWAGFTQTETTVHGRFDIYVDVYPSQDQYLTTVALLDLDYFRIGLEPTGHIFVAGPGSTEKQVSSSETLGAGGWRRIEFMISVDTSDYGWYDVYLYPSRDAEFATESLGGSVEWTVTGGLQEVWFGSFPEWGADARVLLDNIQINDEGVFPGPYVPTTPPNEADDQNSHFANAAVVAIPYDGGIYTSDDVVFAGFGTEPDEPGVGYHSGWWRYQPLTSGTVTFHTVNSPEGLDTILHVYEGDGSFANLTEIGVNDDTGGTVLSEIAVSVTQGLVYHVRVATLAESNAASTYTLTAYGPASEVAPLDESVAAPPADCYVGTPVPDLSGAVPSATVIRSNNFNAGPVGLTITEANSGAGSGDAFDTVVNDGALRYATLNDSVRMLVDGVGDPGAAYATWDLDPAETMLGGKFDIYVSQYPSAPITIFDAGAVKFSLLSTGYLQLEKDAFGFPEAFFTSLGLNVWRRVEWWVNLNTTSQVNYGARLFLSPLATSPQEEKNGIANWSSGWTEFTAVTHGTPYVDDAVYYLDNLKLNSTGVWSGPSVEDINVNTPPSDAYVDTPIATVPGLDLNYAAPPAEAWVQTPAPLATTGLGAIIDAPVVSAWVQALDPRMLDATITLISPTANLAVPTLRPRFTAAVATEDSGARVEFQYATTTAYTDGTILSAPVAYGQAITYVTAQAGTALSDGETYVWRARVVNDFADGDWTPSVSFAISALDGDALAGGTWRVDATATPAPHLWWVVPDRGRPGDKAVCVGTALGTSAATVYIGFTAATGVLYTVAPTAAAYTGDRVIDRDNDRCDPGHQRVAFTVPEVHPPGGPLSVEGS